jgi:hypothetical protein
VEEAIAGGGRGSAGETRAEGVWRRGMSNDVSIAYCIDLGEEIEIPTITREDIDNGKYPEDEIGKCVSGYNCYSECKYSW